MGCWLGILEVCKNHRFLLFKESSTWNAVSLELWSQIGVCLRITIWRAGSNRGGWGPPPKVPGSWALRICISDKFPGDTVGLGEPLPSLCIVALSYQVPKCHLHSRFPYWVSLHSTIHSPLHLSFFDISLLICLLPSFLFHPSSSVE